MKPGSLLQDSIFEGPLDSEESATAEHYGSTVDITSID
jgi:hypothetical protein